MGIKINTQKEQDSSEKKSNNTNRQNWVRSRNVWNFCGQRIKMKRKIYLAEDLKAATTAFVKVVHLVDRSVKRPM
jgi:hypothetical protein